MESASTLTATGPPPVPGASLVIGDRESRRSYFRTFVDIIARCRAQPVELIASPRKGALSRLEHAGIDDYLDRLRTSFAALSARYRLIRTCPDMRSLSPVRVAVVGRHEGHARFAELACEERFDGPPLGG